eukprot:2242648-Pleurochrysis_carterae.AAC.1
MDPSPKQANIRTRVLLRAAPAMLFSNAASGSSPAPDSHAELLDYCMLVPTGGCYADGCVVPGYAPRAKRTSTLTLRSLGSFSVKQFDRRNERLKRWPMLDALFEKGERLRACVSGPRRSEQVQDRTRFEEQRGGLDLVLQVDAFKKHATLV